MDVQEQLEQMTLAEQIRLCSGKNCWETKNFPDYDIPSVWMTDGPHGLRKQGDVGDMLGINAAESATCFPAAALTGCSWDPELLGAIGEAISQEAADKGVGVVLGPGANIKRNPLCGRNFEYFSEDPHLTGNLAAGFIRGIQKNGIGACLKHFAANNQENKRFSSDSVVDERTLREIYLTGFELAVKEGHPAAVMCAYNLLNGTHCSNNKTLLTDILRREWGYDGTVMTDWGALYDRIEAFRAGCDLSMPGGSSFMEQEAWQAVRSGTLDEELVRTSAGRVLTLVGGAHRALEHPAPCDYESHHALARRAAAESGVLLKNDGILPLKKDSHIAIIGSMARQPRYQGAGSSHIDPTQLVSLTDALPEYPYVPGCGERGEASQEQLLEALKLAKSVDTVILAVGLPAYYESEGYDRTNMRMPQGHLALIDAVTKSNPNTVVVLYSGSAVEVPWIDQVRAVLYMGLPGQAGGEATADLLFGRANPCGKLAETWPERYEDCVSSSYYGQKDAHYREGIYVGYRYYDKAEVQPCFPFGFGLSYSTFTYDHLRREGDTLLVEITNQGQAGYEIAQLYVAALESPVYRPVKELKGFAKVWLEPGETKTVSFHLNSRSFAIWQGDWVVPTGDYELLVGASSWDIRARMTIHVEGAPVTAPDWQEGSWYETLEGVPPQEDWEVMLGRPVTAASLVKGQFTMNNTILEMRDYSWVMKLLCWGIEKAMAKMYGGRKAAAQPEFRMMLNAAVDCNISSMIINSGYRSYMLQGLLAIANRNRKEGLRLMRKKFHEAGYEEQPEPARTSPSREEEGLPAEEGSGDTPSPDLPKEPDLEEILWEAQQEDLPEEGEDRDSPDQGNLEEGRTPKDPA